MLMAPQHAHYFVLQGIIIIVISALIVQQAVIPVFPIINVQSVSVIIIFTMDLVYKTALMVFTYQLLQEIRHVRVAKHLA